MSDKVSIIPDPELTEQLVQEGIHKAEITDGEEWLDEAERMFEEYIKIHPRVDFLVAQVRIWAEIERGFLSRYGGKSWGGIVRRMVNRGLITKAGVTNSPHTHGAPVSVWVSV